MTETRKEKKKMKRKERRKEERKEGQTNTLKDASTHAYTYRC